MNSLRPWGRMLLVLLGVLFLSTTAQADTILNLTIGPSPGGPALFSSQWLGTAFTLTSTWTNVTITPTGVIQISGTSDPANEGFSGTMWLTTAYGPGTVAGDVVASTSVSDLSGVSLTGLTLGPGTYYVMLSSNEPIGGYWADSWFDASTLTTGAGVTYQGVGVASSGFGLDPGFAPDSTGWYFGGPPRFDNGVWGIDVTGNAVNAVPEPGTLALMGLGLATLAGLRRKTSS